MKLIVNKILTFLMLFRNLKKGVSPCLPLMKYILGNMRS